MRRGAYSTTSELVNEAVKNLLAQELSASNKSGKPDASSLELARDAPANLEWIERNGGQYTGEWVALHKGGLIAHGRNGLEVLRAAQNQGVDPPLMHHLIAEDGASWGGW